MSDNTPRVDRATRLQPTLTTGAGSITLQRCTLGYFPSSGYWNGHCYLEAREATAEIVVADGVFLNNGATLVAERSSIRIDSDCLIGPWVQIYDSDFHALAPELRTSGRHPCAPVHLERNVFVGASVIILKGVTIGHNSVIGAGSVVINDIPPQTIAAGNPARVIRSL
jgi:maltose O-acetyltransferase